MIVVLQTVLFPVLLLPIKVGDKTLREFVSKWSDLTRALAYADPDTFASKSFPVSDLKMWNARAVVQLCPALLEMELGSFNGVASAEDLGRLASCLANGGEWRGVRIISEEGVREMLKNPKDVMLRGIGVLPVAFTQGGLNRKALPERFRKEPDNELDAVYSWAGWGGSVFVFNPVRRAAAVFTSNAMTWDVAVALRLIVKTISVGSKTDKEGRAFDDPVPVHLGSATTKSAGAKVRPDADVVAPE